MTGIRYRCECGRPKTFYAPRCRRCTFGEWPDRFWAKVDKTGTCWLWRGATGTKGYGMVFVPGGLSKRYRVHRVAYELIVGPIPEGLQLDHLCRVPACVNPAHLEPVTNRENVMRGLIPLRGLRPLCKYGHPYTPANTIRVKADGSRLCRQCQRASERAYRARQKLKAVA